jgi:hypothetical protein
MRHDGVLRGDLFEERSDESGELLPSAGSVGQGD